MEHALADHMEFYSRVSGSWQWQKKKEDSQGQAASFVVSSPPVLLEGLQPGLTPSISHARHVSRLMCPPFYKGVKQQHNQAMSE